MASRNLKRFVPSLILVVALASVSAFAGSAVIGSVAGSSNATLSGHALLPNTTVFSGDSLQVKDGAAVVAVGNSSRMMFGRETVASFARDTNAVTVLLSQGSVSLYHPNDSTALAVKAAGVTISPAQGFKTLGDIAMINGAVVVTSKEGLLKLEGRGAPVYVAKGDTMTVLPKTARAAAPTGAAAAGGVSIATIAANPIIPVAALGAGAASTVLGVVAVSRAGDARDQAALSTSAANAATAAGNAATAAGNAAQSSAAAAQAAANAATSAANAARSNANSIGCALNRFAVAQGQASPYNPPTGLTCP